MDVPNQRSRKKASRRSPRKKAHMTVDETNGYGSDDDLESVTSIASSVDSTFPLDDEENGIDYQADIESKLLDNIEGCRQKSVKARQTCLQEVTKQLTRKCMTEFVLQRKDTLLDLVEKLLKRGQSADRVLCCSLSCALCIQIGEHESLQVFTTLKPVLSNLCNDETLPPATRASAATALSLTCFIGAEEPQDTVDCLNVLKSMFSKKIPSEVSHHTTFTNAILGWGLLLTVASQMVVSEQVDGVIGVICKLLELGDLNLRIAAGEAVSLVYELARESRGTFGGHVNNLFDLLRDLANESGRHKGKREKRQQKTSFRDFLKAVEHGVTPDTIIKFGKEGIELYSWARYRQYNALKDILSGGMNIHLQSNNLLRQIFDLGLPVSDVTKESKEARYERQLMNQAISKDRSMRRGKRRDNKHSAVGAD